MWILARRVLWSQLVNITSAEYSESDVKVNSFEARDSRDLRSSRSTTAEYVFEV